MLYRVQMMLKHRVMDVPKTRPKIDFELAQQYLAWRDSHTNVVSSFVYQAMVTRIVDGDTIDVIIRYDVGFN